MARSETGTAASPAGRGLGYLFDSILCARAEAQELEAMWENDAPIATMANAASRLEDRFIELRVKLYQIAETIDS